MTESAVLLAENGLDGGASIKFARDISKLGDQKMTLKNQTKTEPMTRADLILLCSKILTRLDKKITGRYRPQDNEALFLQTIRAISGLVDSTNRLLRDHEIEELIHRVEQLESRGEETTTTNSPPRVLEYV